MDQFVTSVSDSVWPKVSGVHQLSCLAADGKWQVGGQHSAAPPPLISHAEISCKPHLRTNTTHTTRVGLSILTVLFIREGIEV